MPESYVYAMALFAPTPGCLGGGLAGLAPPVLGPSPGMAPPLLLPPTCSDWGTFRPTVGM